MWDDLDDCIGFDWDDGNLDKSWKKHRVEPHEAEQLFFNRPLVVRRDPERSREEPRFYALGETDGGRWLFVAFTIRHRLIRVISSRDMTRRERRIYEQQEEDPEV